MNSAFHLDMKRFLCLLPCWLAPLSLGAAWTIAPANITMGTGGYRFFLHWLTKYPNLGPINTEVLLGIICIVGLAALPPLFALVTLLTQGARAWLLRFMAASQAILFVPVFVRLDLGLWIFGLWGFGPHIPPYRDALIAPILHVCALVSMLVVFAWFPRREAARAEMHA